MLSENLKSFRKSKGISQEELAVRLNVVRQTISKWEKGLTVPDADTLIRIAEILEVDVSELLGAKVDSKGNKDRMIVLAYMPMQFRLIGGVGRTKCKDFFNKSPIRSSRNSPVIQSKSTIAIS